MNNKAKQAKASNGKMVSRPCQCLSEFQDGQCGRGTRWHTVGTRALTCTVCGKEKVRPIELPDKATGAR